MAHIVARPAPTGLAGLHRAVERLHRFFDRCLAIKINVERQDNLDLLKVKMEINR